MTDQTKNFFAVAVWIAYILYLLTWLTPARKLTRKLHGRIQDEIEARRSTHLSKKNVQILYVESLEPAA